MARRALAIAFTAVSSAPNLHSQASYATRSRHLEVGVSLRSVMAMVMYQRQYLHDELSSSQLFESTRVDHRFALEVEASRSA